MTLWLWVLTATTLWCSHVVMPVAKSSTASDHHVLRSRWAVRGCRPSPGSCLRAQVWRELPPLTFFLRFSFLPLLHVNRCSRRMRSSAVPSADLCGRDQQLHHLDVYLLHWCHCLCWGVWLRRNHPKAVVKCICRIKQNLRMPENASAWCFIIVDAGEQIYISTLTQTLATFKIDAVLFQKVDFMRSSSHAADVFRCVLALMHVCCSARTRLFNKGITTPPALVFLFDTRTLVRWRKASAERAEVSANRSRGTRGTGLGELWLLLILFTSAPSR